MHSSAGALPHLSQILAKSVPTRKRTRPVPWRADFKAALAYAEITAKEYAESEGVTTAHVRAILAGTRQSLRLTDRMKAFMAKHLEGRAA